MNRNKWMTGAVLIFFLGATGIALGHFLQDAKPSTGRTTGMTIAPLTPAQKANEAEKYRLDMAAAAAMDASQYAEAENDARQSIAIGPDSGIAQEVLATALDAQGKTQEALEAYKQIADAGDVEPRNQLPYALLLLKTGQWAQAVAAYNKQLPYLADGKLMNTNSQFSPNMPQPKELETAIHVALGLTYGSAYSWGKHSQVDKATSEYKKAVALEPDSSLANLYYGRVLQRLGHRVEAKAAFAKAAKTGNEDVKAAAEEEMKR